ncbi:hypothetical protein PIB30_003076 [Stylosanthes scabra]|uniref:Uncharacterized protein n=1 Tax=Stylosanthes scabra TaxID=79078 RepID=A0ABU6X0S4_9FABA|nr:hypothetical protein [Stylosanthes scabra]
MVKGNGKSSKKGKAAQPKESPQKKDQGHAFKCVPLSVNVIFEKCIKDDPQKRAIVEELGFGSLKYLPNYYLKHKVLMQLFKRFNTIDNTNHAVAGEVEITTEKIRKSFGLKYTGTTYPDKGKSQRALKELIFNTPIDSDANRDKFKRAFLLYIQKCFFLPTSAPNVTPRALPTIFDLQNTRKKNWALHIHNFLLDEIEKAKENNASSVSGCCFALMVIYFHETHFGKNSQDAEAQPPWIQYWTGETLMNRMKQERTMKAGLIRTAMLVDERREKLKKKGKKGSSSTSEPEYVDSSHESEFEYEADSEQTSSQVMVQRHRRRVIYSSVSGDGHTIAQVVSLANKKRKVLQEKGSKSKKPKKVNVVPRVDSANASLGDNESNAASGNLREENDEQHQSPPHQSPPQEEEPPHHQPPPQEEEPPHHEPPPQQQQHQPSNQSRSEAEPEPTEVEPEPIPIRVLVPKAEAALQYSPGERLLTDTLMIMRMNEQRPPQEEVIEPAPNQEEQQQEQQQQVQQQQQQNQEPASQSVVEVV